MRIEIQDESFEEVFINQKLEKVSKKLVITLKEAHYFSFSGKIENQAYQQKKPIYILHKNGKLKDIAKASDQLNIQALTNPVVKHFICYLK